jgi:hypothetical protein
MGGLALYLLYLHAHLAFAIYTHVSCSDFLYLYSTHWILTVLLLVGVLNIVLGEEWVASKWLDEIWRAKEREVRREKRDEKSMDDELVR